MARTRGSAKRAADAEFSSEDAKSSPEYGGTPAKRTKAAKGKPTKRVKKNAALTAPQRHLQNALLPAVNKDFLKGLEANNLGIPRVSTHTTELNKFMTNYEGVNIALVKPSDIEPQAKHLQNCTPQKNREFVVKSVTKVSVDVTWDPQPDWKVPPVQRNDIDVALASIKTVQSYSIKLEDLKAKGTDARVLELCPIFRSQNIRYRAGETWTYTPILSSTMCSSYAQARAMGDRACVLLNCYPGTDVFSEWLADEPKLVQGGATASALQTIVTVESMRALSTNPDGPDLSQLPPFARHLYSLNGNVNIDLNSERNNIFCYIRTMYFASSRRLLPGKKWDGLQLRIPLTMLQDKAKLTSLNPPAFKSVSYTSNYEPARAETSTDEEVDASGIANERQSSKDGEEDALVITAEDVAALCQYAEYVGRSTYGFVGSPRSIRSVVTALVERTGRSRVGPFNGSPLFRLKDHSSTVPIGAVNKVLPQATAFSHHRMTRCQTFISWEMSRRAFITTKGSIVAAMAALAYSIDLTKLHIHPVDVSNYCDCIDDEWRQTSSHVCFMCGDTRLCCDLAPAADGRLVCAVHFVYGPPSEKEYLLTYVQHLGTHDPKLTKPQLRELAKLVASQRVKGAHWVDEICGGVSRTWSLNDESCRPSIDATFPVSLADNELYYHHISNVTLMTTFLNRLCGPFLKKFLLCCKHALLPKTTTEDLLKICRQVDHLFIIRSFIPYQKDRRIKDTKDFDAKLFPAFKQMMIDGKYDARIKSPYKEWELQVRWNPSTTRGYQGLFSIDRARILRICQQIRDSKKFNPSGLGSMPCGKDKCPWPWNPEHMPDDWCWGYLEIIMAERLHRLDDSCDKLNDHEEESIDNLFLVCVIVYYENGGKCALLGLYMTVFSWHPLNFSIGRRNTVDPGSKMVTGWKKKHPTSLDDDYDDDLRTITMESRAANYGVWRYPVGDVRRAGYREQISQVANEVKGVFGPMHWDLAVPDEIPKSFAYDIRTKGNMREQRATTDDEEGYELEELEAKFDLAAGDEDNEGLKVDVTFEEEDSGQPSAATPASNKKPPASSSRPKASDSPIVLPSPATSTRAGQSSSATKPKGTGSSTKSTPKAGPGRAGQSGSVATPKGDV